MWICEYMETRCCYVALFEYWKQCACSVMAECPRGTKRLILWIACWDMNDHSGFYFFLLCASKKIFLGYSWKKNSDNVCDVLQKLNCVTESFSSNYINYWYGFQYQYPISRFFSPFPFFLWQVLSLTDGWIYLVGHRTFLIFHLERS